MHVAHELVKEWKRKNGFLWDTSWGVGGGCFRDLCLSVVVHEGLWFMAGSIPGR